MSKGYKHLVQGWKDYPEVVNIATLIRTTRPYCLPKNYIKWETLSYLLGAIIFSYQDYGRKMVEQRDLTSLFLALRSSLWYTQNAPVYCLGDKLLRDFQETNINSIGNFYPPLPTFLLCFPRGELRTPEGAEIAWAVVHFSDINKPELSSASQSGYLKSMNIDWEINVPLFKTEWDLQFQVSTLDSSGCCYYIAFGLSPDGQILLNTKKYAGLSKVSDEDDKFLARLRNVVLSCILAIAYEPSMLHSAIKTTPTTKGFASTIRTAKKKEIWAPRLLKLSPEIIQRSKQIYRKGSSTPKRPHWRCAHEKRVPCGKGRQNRKIVQISPTWVNGEA